jgi:hypothetical protein
MYRSLSPSFIARQRQAMDKKPENSRDYENINTGFMQDEHEN